MIIENIVLKKIIASDGMVLTDGETYGKIIFLAKDSDITKWHEITKEEYEAILAEEEKRNKAEFISDINSETNGTEG